MINDIIVWVFETKESNDIAILSIRGQSCLIYDFD